MRARKNNGTFFFRLMTHSALEWADFILSGEKRLARQAYFHYTSMFVICQHWNCKCYTRNVKGYELYGCLSCFKATEGQPFLFHCSGFHQNETCYHGAQTGSSHTAISVLSAFCIIVPA